MAVADTAWWALALCVVLLLAPTPAKTADARALWSALAKGGHVALMRHALAPGIGDPEGFRLEACETQRNLNDEGRDQARRTGEAFRHNGVAVGKVLSSEWCRCVETAELMKLAAMEKLPALNSFFESRENESAQTRTVRSMLAQLDLKGASVVMVTHQVNITALTGEYPQSGEIVVLKLGGPDGFSVAGRIPAR